MAPPRPGNHPDGVRCLGIAAGLGDVAKASPALPALATNVAMLVVGGSLTLMAHHAASASVIAKLAS